MVKNKARVSSFGQMVPSTMASFLTITYMEWVFISGPMDAFMMDSGNLIK